MACLAYCASFGQRCSGDQPVATDLSNDRWRDLVIELNAEDYVARERAFQALFEAREVAFNAVFAAAMSSDERAVRAVALLEKWAFGSTGEFPIRCEKALMTLVDSAFPEAASLANGALATARDIRQVQAYDALAGMKAGIRFIGDGNFDYHEVLETQGETRDDVTDKLRPIALISIYPGWTGGVEGLWHLKRLQHQAGLQILIADRVIPEIDVTKLVSNLESSSVQFRGASLGLRAQTGSPLTVEEALPGGAAAKVGLQYGDVVLAFDGKEVSNISDLITVLREYAPGDTKELKIYRPNPGRMLFGRGILDDNEIQPADLPVPEPAVDDPSMMTVTVTLQGWEKMPTPPNAFRMTQQQNRAMRFQPNFFRPPPRPVQRAPIQRAPTQLAPTQLAPTQRTPLPKSELPKSELPKPELPDER